MVGTIGLSMMVLVALLFAPGFAHAGGGQGIVIQPGPTFYDYYGYPNYPSLNYPYGYSYPYYPYRSWYGYPNGFYGGPGLSFGFTFGHGHRYDYDRYRGGSHYQRGPYFQRGYRDHGG